MAKYLIQASYTAEGFRGVMKDTASGRKAAITKLAEGLGGKAECVYYAFGADDVIVVLDLPDNTTAAAVSIAVAASGLVRLRTTPLLTVEEVDKALKKSVDYKPPGH